MRVFLLSRKTACSNEDKIYQPTAFNNSLVVTFDAGPSYNRYRIYRPDDAA